MRKGQVNVFFLLLFLSLSSASDQKWRKAMMSAYNGSSSSSSMMMNRVGSSILFPIHGNVYPTGYYNVTINIGHPPKPYFLDLDTGSDLTWLQCNAPCVHCIEAPHPLYQPSNDLVACRHPLCAALHPPDYKCESPDQCDYEVEYADGGSSLGVLVRDVFSLNYTNGVRLSPRLALGCGYDQIPGTSYHPLDGILGLGRGKSSIVSQLQSQGLVRNVVGHCLSGRGGGFLFFGDGLYDSSHVTWTSMSQEFTKYYSPGSAELHFGGKATGIKNLIVIFDSGSSYTYLNSQAYQALTLLLKKELSGRSLKEAPEDQTLPLCWKGRKPFRSVHDAKKYFKTSLALAFANSGRRKTQFELHPEAYLIISNKGNVCLGILNGTQVGLQNLNVIGDISMQDRMVVYDNEKQVIGWSPANCDHLPRFKSSYYM
ncbi:aspartic proteinase Asp1 [Gossypium australe]|uniref:Aspartic proteinase Asp1 n=1 Tax=Gossypium australe TaxID=47621 RepID=A0A5B6W1F7_9ROSI|nr:aspartic proteinase Asp1 [Gossypium australe]